MCCMVHFLQDEKYFQAGCFVLASALGWQASRLLLSQPWVQALAMAPFEASLLGAWRPLLEAGGRALVLALAWVLASLLLLPMLVYSAYKQLDDC